MTTKQAQAEEVRSNFIRDTAGFVLSVRFHQGFYRHLVVHAPDGGFFARHEIVTWPGHLCITGDFGSFTFHRHGTTDMFEFFRHGDGPEINPTYWKEKLIAVDAGGSLTYTTDRRYRYLWCLYAIVNAIKMCDRIEAGGVVDERGGHDE